MSDRKVLMTGAAGYIASQLLPTFRERYDMVMIDVSAQNRHGERVRGVKLADLLAPDHSEYGEHFQGVDAVVHLAFRPHSGDPIDHFFDEKANVEMAYNVLRAAYEAEVPRVVVASSNHAADWYEHALIHQRKMESLDPYKLPLSDNFYGWAKATYEHLGFLFACGAFDSKLDSGDEHLPSGHPTSKMSVIMVRIGAPRELDIKNYVGAQEAYKRDLGAYISQRDLTQLFVKAIETPNVDNEDGISWQVVYGISNNTRAFWSLVNARSVLGYHPEDDSEVRYARDIQEFLLGAGATGRVGLS